MFKRNLIANYLGQGWTALMGLCFVPLYIRYLGMEAFGLIGLFAMMQAWFGFLDLGMTPTMNREMARFAAGGRSLQSIRDLLRSFEVLCFSIALVIGVGVWAGADYVARGWLRVDQLSVPVVAQAVSVMALVVALRFCEGIYRGALFGLQRQVWYNGVNAVLATLRHGGAVLVLAWVSPTVRAFFLWQALVSVISLITLASGVHFALPRAPAVSRFTLDALRGVRRFAGGMVGISILALILTQVDKLLLSGLLPLETFGRYTLAATVAGALYLVIIPIDQAIYPRLVELVTRGDLAGLSSLYHQGAQLVTIMTAPAVIILSLFAKDIVFVWSGDAALARSTAPILSILVVGTFLNGVMHIPYQLQLAYGWTTLAIKTNLVAVSILVPALLWVVPRYGAVGAAWLWVMLNAGYVLIAIHFMHQRLIPAEKGRWYMADILAPSGGTLVVMMAVRHFTPVSYGNRWHSLIFVGVIGIMGLAAAMLCSSTARARLTPFMRRLSNSVAQ